MDDQFKITSRANFRRSVLNPVTITRGTDALDASAPPAEPPAMTGSLVYTPPNTAPESSGVPCRISRSAASVSGISVVYLFRRLHSTLRFSDWLFFCGRFYKDILIRLIGFLSVIVRNLKFQFIRLPCHISSYDKRFLFTPHTAAVCPPLLIVDNSFS